MIFTKPGPQDESDEHDGADARLSDIDDASDHTRVNPADVSGVVELPGVDEDGADDVMPPNSTALVAAPTTSAGPALPSVVADPAAPAVAGEPEPEALPGAPHSPTRNQAKPPAGEGDNAHHYTNRGPAPPAPAQASALSTLASTAPAPAPAKVYDPGHTATCDNVAVVAAARQAFNEIYWPILASDAGASCWLAPEGEAGPPWMRELKGEPEPYPSRALGGSYCCSVCYPRR